MLRDTILPQWHDASASGRHAGRKNHDGATEQLLELAVRQLQALTGRVVSYPPCPCTIPIDCRINVLFFL